MRRTLFKPLGMGRSSASIPELRKQTDAARPYKKDDAEQVSEVPYYEDALCRRLGYEGHGDITCTNWDRLPRGLLLMELLL